MGRNVAQQLRQRAAAAARAQRGWAQQSCWECVRRAKSRMSPRLHQRQHQHKVLRHARVLVHHHGPQPLLLARLCKGHPPAAGHGVHSPPAEVRDTAHEQANKPDGAQTSFEHVSRAWPTFLAVLGVSPEDQLLLRRSLPCAASRASKLGFLHLSAAYSQTVLIPNSVHAPS